MANKRRKYTPSQYRARQHRIAARGLGHWDAARVTIVAEDRVRAALQHSEHTSEGVIGCSNRLEARYVLQVLWDLGCRPRRTTLDGDRIRGLHIQFEV